jgi:hypothetical protein
MACTGAETTGMYCDASQNTCRNDQIPNASSSIGLIVGGVVGALIIVGIIIFSIIRHHQQQRRRQQSEPNNTRNNANMGQTATAVAMMSIEKPPRPFPLPRKQKYFQS